MTEDRSDIARNRLRIHEIATSSTATTIPATTSAVVRSEMRNGSVWAVPPRAVISPVTIPRRVAGPRPVWRPSSDSASDSIQRTSTFALWCVPPWLSASTTDR